MRHYDIPGVLHELRYRRSRRRGSKVQQPQLPDAPLVSVICVSNRPDQAPHIAATYNAQDWKSKELIVVANAAGYDPSVFATVDSVQFLHRDATTTLGECLNVAMAAAKGDVIARIDDDDFYAPGYLTSVLAAFNRTHASVVGKAEYFAYIESMDLTVLRFAGNGNRYVGRVAGGTIALLTAARGSVRFPHQNIGEDVEFLRACERNGMRIWADHPKGFLQIRRALGDHTWRISDADFAASSKVVGSGRPDSAWI